MIMRKKLLVNSLLVCLLSYLLVASCVAKDDRNNQLDVSANKRNQLIGYMLGKMLPGIHFSDKKVDDNLAEAVFDLYISQLDYQKRFLLQSDVDTLRSFTDQIDNNLMSGHLVLPKVGYDILASRIIQVEQFVQQIFDDGFDINREESYQTDPEKDVYQTSLDGLRDKWRKIIKAQVISRYLDLIEDRQENEGEPQKSDQELFAEASEKIKKRNLDFFKRLHQETVQDHYDRFFGAVSRAFDPHTNYMAPAKKEDFDIQMRGSLEGIGALLREEDGYVKVVSIMPGSASAKQGQLEAEDIILAVAEKEAEPVEITDMRLSDAVRLIRGPKGTEVRLTVRKPDGRQEIIPITRDVVQMEEAFVKHTMLTSNEGEKVGYIYVPSFYRDFEKTRNGTGGRNSTEDTLNAIDSLKREGMEALILDLRNNGGGSLIDAVDISGLFIDSGPVVQVKYSNGDTRVLVDDTEGASFTGTMVVLVNQFSASASEIVAAALQDYNRAVIIGGKHTHGKGTVQTIIDLNENIPLLELKKYDDLGALKVTIQKFYRVNGGSTQYRGVLPDVVLPDLFQHLESGEQYLDYSLPWDQVPPINYVPAAPKVANLDLILERSAKRVAQDDGFQAIVEEAQRSAEKRDDTIISLKLSDMKARRDELSSAREKLGRYYKKYQREENEDGENPVQKTPAEEDLEWLEEVLDDPYVREAKNIIDDMNLP